MSTTSELFAQIEGLYDEMVAIRRHLHENPELSFEEVETPKFIANYLTELGVEVETGVGGRGVIGRIYGGKPGKTVALRADFDALAIQDEKDVPYRSKVAGKMHACGHDGHTATLLAVAKVLQTNRELLTGNVVLIHQFAEELAPGGAKPMIEAGCLDGVDAVFGMHLWSMVPHGNIGWAPGPSMAAADRFAIKINGRGGHGASPHETIDSLYLATQVVSQFQSIVSRRLDPLQPAVLTVATFNSGSAFNVIPDSAEIGGTVRTFDTAVQDQIIEEMDRVIKGVCEGSGATYSFDFFKGYPAVVNHEKEAHLVANAATKVVGAEHVVQMQPIMGGEDFSYFLLERPGAFFFTGAGNPDVGATYPHHHPKFDFDERAMVDAANVLIQVTFDYLEG